MKYLMKNLFLIISILISLSIYQKGFSQQVSIKKQTIKNLLDHEVQVDSINNFLNIKMEELKVPGVSLVIINNGKVVFHKIKGYADVEGKKKINKRTVFEGASISKPLFAYFTMMFVEEGKLDLDKPLYEYLPYDDIAYDDRYQKITARMVLSHTTGFPNWRTDIENSKLTITFDPGTSFEYSGEGYQYLAKVLAHILETDDIGLEAIYQERIARPFNMKCTKYIQDAYNLKHKAKPYDKGHRIDGEKVLKEFGSAYSIHSEAVDFSKWIIALMNQKGLTKENFSELFKSQVVLPADAKHRQQGITDWTLGFAKASLPFGILYGHGGNNPGYTSLFGLNREKKWGFVMFTNANQSPLALQLLMYLNSK